MNRRDFLKTAGSAAALSYIPQHRLTGQDTAPTPTREAIDRPPHRPISVPGLHAYSEKSLRAGDVLQLRVSSADPYEADICRLGEIDRPETDTVLEKLRNDSPESHPIHPGSYVFIAPGLSPEMTFEAMTLECWVRPWKSDGWQGLLTQHDYPHHCGFGLFLSNGAVEFYLGNGSDYQSAGSHSGPQLALREWHHIVGTWDGRTKALWVDGHRVGRWSQSSIVRPGPAPIRLAAYGHEGVTVNFLDGDLASPVIYNRALSPSEIGVRFAQSGTSTRLRLHATSARLRGPSVRLNPVSRSVSYWTGPRDRAIWTVPDLPAGTYDVFLEAGPALIEGESEFELRVNRDSVLKAQVRAAEHPAPAGRIRLTGGDTSFTLRPSGGADQEYAELRAIELVAVDAASQTQPKPLRGAVAYWPLDEERGDRVRDISGGDRHGRIINGATWMIGGPGFDAAAVPRFAPYDPATDPRRGHGLRFASDDLFDCHWPVTHSYAIPAEAKPGVYCVRFRYSRDGERRWYHSTFLVRGQRNRGKPPILMLCSTGTWLAYNMVPFSVGVAEGQQWFSWPANSAQGAPAYCCYTNHAHGQPTYFVGLNLPWPSAGPEVMYSPEGVGYSHLMRGERFTHRWLETQGYDYDVAADHDLTADPGLLEGYQTVIINGHSEYWSTPAIKGLDRYLGNGGTAIVLSGNTMFWRTSYNGEQTVMECRKFDSRIGGRPGAAIGEIWHSQDGQRGSMVRESGFPEWNVIGMGTLGYWGVNASNFGVLKATRPDHFLFQRPEPIDLKAGDTFGHAPGGSLPRAIGHEADGRLSTLVRMTRQPIPDGYTLPEESAGIVTLAQGIRDPADGMILDLFAEKTPALENVCSEMIYWDRPAGGRVFHAGAIGTGWALQGDRKWAALLRNVLHHFGISRR